VKFKQLFKSSADWMRREGPSGDIVLSSRVRLARNLPGHSYPGWAEPPQREAVLGELLPIVEALPEMKGAFRAELGEMELLEKQFLVERHLVSREHAAREGGCAAVVDEDQSLSIMINEEDHLRMQAIVPGLDIVGAHRAIDQIDTVLDSQVGFAFDDQFGYLTSCPTNLGTGLRASAMLHLPGLVLADHVKQVVAAANKIGLAVRGIYGEGTEALANFFQISNQNTLGEEESVILERLQSVIEQIVTQERNARATLVEENRAMICDRIGRGYGVLRHAHVLSSKEALEHLSMLRLGADLGVLNPNAGLLRTLFAEIQPAHLQLAAGRTIEPEERDALRADFLQRRLKSLKPPNMLPLGKDIEGASTPEEEDSE